jgi:hypothetical protein
MDRVILDEKETVLKDAIDNVLGKVAEGIKKKGYDTIILPYIDKKPDSAPITVTENKEQSVTESKTTEHLDLDYAATVKSNEDTNEIENYILTYFEDLSKTKRETWVDAPIHVPKTAISGGNHSFSQVGRYSTMHRNPGIRYFAAECIVCLLAVLIAIIYIVLEKLKPVTHRHPVMYAQNFPAEYNQPLVGSSINP